MNDITNNDSDDTPKPNGELTLQTTAMPADSNYDGDIFGGWLVSQMDLAGAVKANRLARGRVATVAIDSMVFLRPVAIGSVISCYSDVLNIGRSSITIRVEVWAQHYSDAEARKVTEGQFTFVAIDEHRRTRPVPRTSY